MGSQVAVAEVAVVPTFKGFRKLVTSETDSSAKAGAQGFSRAFAKTGAESGQQVGAGFKKAFEKSADGASSKATKALEADVAKASRALSAARLKEQDAIGKVRVAQAQLNEANGKYSADSSQVIRAQERLATASRQLGTAHEGTEKATDDLKRSQGELARAADNAGDELAEAGNKGVTGFRSSVVGGVKSFAGPLVAAFAALGIGNIVADAFSQAKDFIVGAIDVASSLSESVNAVQVSYGDAADEIMRLGENSAKTFGLSKLDLNQYATQFSAFVKTIAGSGGDVAGTFETLVGRGTDFASVMDVEVSDALSLFQSGLAGETEPLRKYGIDLSAAAVQAYALANGIGDGSGALTEAEKVQARYGALLEQTNAVAGDFANTQDSLANANRTNSATWEDLQAQIGDSFLPVATELATLVRDDLLPVIAKLAEEQGPALGEAFAEALPKLAELAKDVLPLIPGLLESFAEALPPIIEFVGWLTPLLADLTKAGNDQIGMYGALFGLLSGESSLADFGNKLTSLGGPIGDVNRWGAGLVNGFTTWFGQISTTVSTKVGEVAGFLGGLPARALAAIGDLGRTLYSSGEALMGGFLDGIKSMIDKIGRVVSGAIDWVMGFFPHSPAKRGPLSGAGWTQLGKSGEAFWDQWLGGMGGEGPEFPTFAGGGSGTAPSSGAGGSSPAGPRTVNQYIYPQQTDARLQVRQWGREAERAFAAS